MSENVAADAVTGARSFEAVALTLREQLAAGYVAEASGPLSRASIDTNSDLVAERGGPTLRIALDRMGTASLHGLNLLDLGCGYGGLSALFAFHGAQVLAVDPNPERLKVIRRVAEIHALNIRATVGQMPRLSVRDSSVNVVVMNNSLCYVTDLAERAIAVAEARRVLSPAGVVITLNRTAGTRSRGSTRCADVGTSGSSFARPSSCRKSCRRLAWLTCAITPRLGERRASSSPSLATPSSPHAHRPDSSRGTWIRSAATRRAPLPSSLSGYS